MQAASAISEAELAVATLLAAIANRFPLPGEIPQVGLILCAGKRTALARYAPEGLPNRVVAAEYRTALPDEAVLAAELDKSRLLLAAAKPAPKR